MAEDRQARRSGAHTRAVVLAAAERLFAAHGYRGTSLEEIGREAGLSRGTPGYFFGSKERLYGAVLSRILERAQSALAPAGALVDDESVPVAETVERLASAYVGVLASEPALVRLIQWETLEGHGQILGAIGAQANAFVDVLRRLAARERRELDEVDAAKILIAASALCWFPYAHASALEQTFGRDERTPAAAAALAKDVAGLVLDRLEAAGRPLRATA